MTWSFILYQQQSCESVRDTVSDRSSLGCFCCHFYLNCIEPWFNSKNLMFYTRLIIVIDKSGTETDTDQQNMSVFECFLPVFFSFCFGRRVFTFQHGHNFPLQCIPDTPPSAMMMLTAESWASGDFTWIKRLIYTEKKKEKKTTKTNVCVSVFLSIVAKLWFIYKIIFYTWFFRLYSL